MTSTVVARRYAKALFAVAQEDGKFDEYCQVLNAMGELVSQYPQVKDALVNPLYPLDVKAKVMEELIKAMAAPQIMANFFKLLVTKRRAGIIPEIVKKFQGMVDAHENISRGIVVTATEIQDSLMGRIQETLEKITGTKVVLEKKVDPSILGGMIAKVGDMVVDGSIKTQLMGLKDTIKRSE